MKSKKERSADTYLDFRDEELRDLDGNQRLWTERHRVKQRLVTFRAYGVFAVGAHQMAGPEIEIINAPRRARAFFCFLKILSGVRMLTTFYLAKNDHRWVTFIFLKTILEELKGE